MDDYLEFEKDTKLLKSINLDDFSTEDLKKYIEQLKKEILRVEIESEKKLKSQKIDVVIAVHMAGHSSEMKSLYDLKKKYNFF